MIDPTLAKRDEADDIALDRASYLALREDMISEERPVLLRRMPPRQPRQPLVERGPQDDRGAIHISQ